MEKDKSGTNRGLELAASNVYSYKQHVHMSGLTVDTAAHAVRNTVLRCLWTQSLSMST